MDTTGTFEMAIAFARNKMCVACHKHYSVEDWVEFSKAHPEVLPFVAVSAGSSQRDFEKLLEVVSCTAFFFQRIQKFFNLFSDNWRC
jgi:GMP reductase